ncbi:DNA-binding transcriptional LysR family regulator [Xanthobacter flavus]|uniref:DNA-binding transcriptional LysR family regulator n=1 Tax=Xanthobacter flavus TaxID=281 RepID=A0A9W6CPU7_XANFL|nr:MULTISPECIES: LysR family transcriptional regulator [Xanthobacter]MDR6335468.1 DNA-binding transcriptional LysR family regulator [Xanthobacter flavus]NMN58794.1 DNA-binding transcriptional LysR family regulator [Xanthobacter sp. SG618]GLI23976.1 LysR family transcriptional regulator [Xanthobacter flavus]
MDRPDRTGEMAAFLKVACAGSLSGAARELGLTPSAVSRILARIEARLGVRLMVRTTRQLRLTEEGEAYARAARRILADIDETEAALADRANPRGRIRVSASMAHGRLVIVPLLGEFVARYPDIEVEMELSDEIADVLGGRVDVAIRFGPLADSPLTARRLGETGRTVIAAPSYLARHGTPRVPADLARHNCLDFSFRRIEPGWPFREDGRDYMLEVKGNITANNGETLVQLAAQGVGITRVGNFHIDEANARGEFASGALVPLLEAFNPQDRESIHAVFVGGANTPARVRVFVDFLAEKLRRAPPA